MIYLILDLNRVRQDGFFTSATLYEIYLLYRQKHYCIIIVKMAL